MQLEAHKAEAEARAKFEAEAARAVERKISSSSSADDEGQQQPSASARFLRNQFNFVDRAAQTANYLPRDRETMTEPPPTATVSGVRQGGRVGRGTMHVRDWG